MSTKPSIDPFRFASRRSVVYGRKGVVSCSQPLAAEAGLEILRNGGNAVDAAVAVSAALNVTEPSSCGIGGDAFCLFYDAKSKSVKGLNGSGRAPAALTIEGLRKAGIVGDSIPAKSMHSVTVPGAAAAWVDSVNEFGSGKLSIADVLAPAIRLAEEGVPVSELHAHSWQNSEDLIKNASPDASAMLLNGHAPKAGEIMRFPDLAATFRMVAEHGKPGFYEGPVAQAIVNLIQSKGGVMTMDDLKNHESTVITPVSYTLKNGVTLYECPPNGQGLTALMALGILEALEELGSIPPISELQHNSVPYLHALIESLRLAFADTRYYVTDPEVEHVPVKEMLSKAYLKQRAKLFNPQKAVANVQHGSPVNSSDTVYFSVTDQWGNACSFICSNYMGFGTGAIPHGCGFTLQNRGCNFSLTEGHPNQLKPGKRPYHTIIPAMATRPNGDLWMSFGCMGGFMQPQGHVQILLSMLYYGLSPQEAIDAPRFCISAGIADAEVNKDEAATAGDINSEVYFEDSIPVDVVDKLREMGHDCRVLSGFARSMVGRAQVIERIPNKNGELVWGAGSDPRGDGHSVPQI